MGMSGGVDDISPSIHTWPQDRIYSIYAPLRCVKQLATISDYLYTFLDPLHGSMYPVLFGKLHRPGPCQGRMNSNKTICQFIILQKLVSNRYKKESGNKHQSIVKLLSMLASQCVKKTRSI